MQCPSCGALNGRADQSCRMCGGALPIPPPPVASEEPIGAGPSAAAVEAPVDQDFSLAGSPRRARTSPPRCPSCFAVNIYSAVFCRSCGARLPEEPLESDGAVAPSADRTGPAWESASGYFDLRALFATMRAALFAPNVTFLDMRREGGVARPLGYVLVMHLVFLPVYVLMFWLAGSELRGMAHESSRNSHSDADLPSREPQAQAQALGELMREAAQRQMPPEELHRRMAELTGESTSGDQPTASHSLAGAEVAHAVDVALGPIGLVIGVPLFMLMAALTSLLVGTLTIHLALKLVGAARSLETTFRALCYSSGSSAPLQLVPGIGTTLGSIWALVISVIAQARAHDTTVWRVLGGYVLMVVLLVAGTCTLALL